MKKKLIVGYVVVGMYSANMYAKETDSVSPVVSIGVDKSTGNYGLKESTDITYVPLTLKLEGKSASVKLTVPYITISGPSNVVGGIDSSPIVTSKGSTTRRTVSGTGDVVASVSQAMVQNRWYGIDLTGKVKLPTADEKQGLGTGKTDYAVQVDGYRTSAPYTVFSSLGYRIMGQPDGVKFNNVPYASLGSLYHVNKNTSIGFALDYRQSVVDGKDPQKELSILGSYSLTQQTKLQAYYVMGQGNSSPNTAAGVLLNVRF